MSTNTAHRSQELSMIMCESTRIYSSLATNKNLTVVRMHVGGGAIFLMVARHCTLTILSASFQEATKNEYSIQGGDGPMNC